MTQRAVGSVGAKFPPAGVREWAGARRRTTRTPARAAVFASPASPASPRTLTYIGKPAFWEVCEGIRGVGAHLCAHDPHPGLACVTTALAVFFFPPPMILSANMRAGMSTPYAEARGVACARVHELARGVRVAGTSGGGAGAWGSRWAIPETCRGQGGPRGGAVLPW